MPTLLRPLAPLLCAVLVACSGAGGSDPDARVADDVMVDRSDLTKFAKVSVVAITGGGGLFQLRPLIKSPDIDCGQYADWWEVIDPDTGELIFRQVFTALHVNEQPFQPTGDDVPIAYDRQVIVRVHMNPHGYGGVAAFGTTMGMSASTDLTHATRFPELAKEAPQPPPCTP